MTGVILGGTQLETKTNQRSTWLQDATTFPQHLTLAIRVLQDFDHGDRVEALGGERLTLAGRLHPRYRLAESLQVRHLPIDSADISRVPY